MQVKILLAAFTCLSASLAFALPPKPDKCPDVTSIKKAGLMTVEWDGDTNQYIASQINGYGTSANWAFAISIPNTAAQSADDALTRARSLLGSLTGIPIPVAFENMAWICRFNDLPGAYPAVAVTPFSVTDSAPALKVKR